tara:strand:+ start:222 stop:437 length:216 start_codon:yes stop_codon:yes gene_type:complete
MKLYLVEDINLEQTSWFESKREAKQFIKSENEGHLSLKELNFPVTKKGIMYAIDTATLSAGQEIIVQRRNK